MDCIVASSSGKIFNHWARLQKLCSGVLAIGSGRISGCTEAMTQNMTTEGSMTMKSV
jgi:hypothetical protein